MEEEEALFGATRSGNVKRGLTRRHYASLKELKLAHKRVHGDPTLYLVGKIPAAATVAAISFL